MVLTNQITEFFDQHSLRKESIDEIKFFAHSYLKKAKYETNVFGWLWLIISSHTRNYRVFLLMLFGHTRGEVKFRTVRNERFGFFSLNEQALCFFAFVFFFNSSEMLFSYVDQLLMKSNVRHLMADTCKAM